MSAVFLNRHEAGEKLARQLLNYKNHARAIVLGLPRGGVPVAYEIAKKLNLPLDVCLVKKIGMPKNSELAIGAIAEDALLHDYSGEITVLDRDLTLKHSIDPMEIQAIAGKVKAELRWREGYYRHHRPLLTVKEKIVIVVDDGIATGCTMHAAVDVLLQHQPQKIIVASPVASQQGIKQLETLPALKMNRDGEPASGNIICSVVPKRLNAVGLWYEDFSQVSDREVCDLLSQQTVKT